MPYRLVLASGSRYRQQQLRAAGYEFESVSPNIDESPLENETPAELASRLAYQKAIAVLTSRPSAIVIGGDQVCSLNNDALGKPGTISKAIAQLQRMSNQVVIFHSAVAVLAAQQAAQFCVPTEVRLRELSQTEIENYVALDSPLDSAGAIKSEKRGSHLFESVSSKDPSALIGLPLIQLAATLREFGVNPLLPTKPNT
ncbi:MAG: septum formation protein Maf [Gammaproteobacteria bacterium]|nr:septum formation protein Maf [Gammaproteobacteria bacterium]